MNTKIIQYSGLIVRQRCRLERKNYQRLVCLEVANLDAVQGKVEQRNYLRAYCASEIPVGMNR